MTKHLITINLAMVCISTSGALGRYMTISPLTIMWIRCILAAALLAIYCLIAKNSLRIQSGRDARNILFAGILLGLHWVLYFFSLQYTNVAIGMLILFTYPLFATLIEPLVKRTGFSLVHLLSGLAILLGLYIIIPDFTPGGKMLTGVILGLISALAYTCRNLIMKPLTGRYSGMSLMVYQMVMIAVILIPFQQSVQLQQAVNFGVPLFLLALLTTAVGHTLFLSSFKHFSISTASILSSLQPVYGIIIAFFALGEVPGWQTIIGGLIILGTVVVNSVLIVRKGG